MATILVVEDVAIFREPIAATLQLFGHTPVCAANGREAIDRLRTRTPDLILLDLAMPQMDGIAFLRQLRTDARFARTPVILLTAITDRDRLVEAVQCGVQECLLKSRFSTKELLARIARHLGPGARDDATGGNTSVTPPAVRQATARPDVPAMPATPFHGEIPQLLTREQSFDRATKAMEVCTLSGVTAQVITLAASPRSDLTSLASLISRDALLSAKVLQAANSAAYSLGGSTVLDINDAVRRVGCATIRNIATMLGIYDSMPSAGGDDAELGFVRCWQHSLAVATLCEQLVAQSAEPDGASVAYLVGLCHDLGEILCHSHFHAEYAQVLDYERRTGKPRGVLERHMLGITHHDLIELVLNRIGLPDNIRQPISEFHDSVGKPGAKVSPLTKVLRLADAYANGMMLGTSRGCDVQPFTRAECKTVTGKEDPVTPPADKFRGDILAQTVMLARLPAAVERAFMAPLFPRSSKRLWLARDPGLSQFDPVATAVGAMADVQVHDRLPAAHELAEVDRVLVLTRTAGTANFGADDVRRVAAAKPCLWLVGKHDGPGAAGHPWPVGATQLAEFIAARDVKGADSVAA